jgi:hypothetical protein
MALETIAAGWFATMGTGVKAAKSSGSARLLFTT